MIAAEDHPFSWRSAYLMLTHTVLLTSGKSFMYYYFPVTVSFYDMMDDDAWEGSPCPKVL